MEPIILNQAIGISIEVGLTMAGYHGRPDEVLLFFERS